MLHSCIDVDFFDYLNIFYYAQSVNQTAAHVQVQAMANVTLLLTVKLHIPALMQQHICAQVLTQQFLQQCVIVHYFLYIFSFLKKFCISQWNNMRVILYSGNLREIGNSYKDSLLCTQQQITMFIYTQTPLHTNSYKSPLIYSGPKHMPQYTVSHPRSKSCDTTHAAYSIGLPHLVNIFTLNLVNDVENSQLITTHSVHTLISSL